MFGEKRWKYGIELLDLEGGWTFLERLILAREVKRLHGRCSVGTHATNVGAGAEEGAGSSMFQARAIASDPFLDA